MVLRDHAVPRKLRIEYEGAICHVLNRGDRREPIFRDDADRKRFLETLDEACVKTDWQIHALCLMGNYFHLVVETPEGNLVEGMKWFSGHLHGAVQPAAQVVRSSVQRALQGAGGGCGSAGLLPHGVRVCALESGAGEIAEAGAIAAGLRLEQLPLISSSETFRPLGYFRRSRRHVTFNPLAVVVFAIRFTMVS